MILIYELFPHCNLNCDFCFQRSCVKKDEYKNNYIKTPIDYIKQAKQSFLNNLKDENIELLCLWGGELFYDNSEEYIEVFWDFINTIKPKELFFYTNLMKINKVLEELIFGDWKIQEHISYDPVGRFKTVEQEEIFFNNLERIKTAERYKEKRINISVILQPEVITRQCDLTKLKELMNDESINIVFKEYERPYPDDIKENYNEIILDFYKEFYKCDNVKHLKDGEKAKDDSILLNHYCPCFSGAKFFTYANDFELNEKATCDSFLNGKDQFEEFLSNYNCSTCEFKNKCTDICPSRMINSGLKNCYRKYLYEHLEEIPDENDTI